MNASFIDVREEKEYWPTKWVFSALHKKG